MIKQGYATRENLRQFHRLAQDLASSASNGFSGDFEAIDAIYVYVENIAFPLPLATAVELKVFDRTHNRFYYKQDLIGFRGRQIFKFGSLGALKWNISVDSSADIYYLLVQVYRGR